MESIQNFAKSRNYRNNEHGITLAVLIITIVVLLILAGITVANITGGDGVMNKASQQKNENNKADKRNKIELAVTSALMKEKFELTANTLSQELKSAFKDNEELKTINDYWYYKGYKIYKDGRVEKLLPEEYQQVEYIESTGTQWIDTKVKQSDFCNNLKGYMEFQFTNLNNRSCVGGCRNSNSWDFFFIFLADSEKFQSNLGHGRDLEIRIANSDLNKHYFTFDSHLGTCNFDGLTTNYNNNLANVPYNIYLFAYNDADSGVSRVSFLKNYDFSLQTSKDILIRKFIPCYSTTTVTDVDGIERPKNTIGMYDIVNTNFYTNQGTGEFIAGPDV